MNTTRPATPPAAERRLVATEVGGAVVDGLAGADLVVGRVVPGVVEAGSALPARVWADRRVEVEAGSVVVGLVAAVPAAGRWVEPVAVAAGWPAPGPAVVVGPALVAVVLVAVVVPAVGVPAVGVLAVGVVPAGLNGSSVRAVDRLPEPSAGTVTSGTVAPGEAAPDRTAAVPDTGRPELPEAVPDVAGEDCSAAAPQAANSTAAMP